MQMTISIDDDVLAVAEERAAAEQRSVGEVISAFARQAMEMNTNPSFVLTRNGIPLLPGGRRVTSELVRQLDEEIP